MGSLMDTHALHTQIQLVKQSTTQLQIAKQQLHTYRSEISSVYQSDEQVYLLLAINQQLTCLQQMLNRCAVLQKQLTYQQATTRFVKGGW